MTPADKFQAFAALHKPGAPLILYNVWDAGSARAVVEVGAPALATGSWSVAASQGFTDAESLPLDLAIANAERVVRAVEVPVSIDFEGGYAVEPERLAANMARLAATGAVGCNFEDQVIGGEGIHPFPLQAERIRASRTAVGADFFINARTDIFLQAPRETHDAALVEQALERGRAYAEAGASGFFVPGLADLALLARICEGSPLPINFMAFPGAPSAADVAAAGVARISYGPFPYRALMKALREAAEKIYG